MSQMSDQGPGRDHGMARKSRMTPSVTATMIVSPAIAPAGIGAFGIPAP
jgi:hypothetical protein